MTTQVTRRRQPGSVGFAVTVATLVLVATFGGYVRPPAAIAATSPFTDIVGTTFEADIDWLYAEGITVGCAPTLYCPADPVSRGQMASFLARMFDLPATSTDYFSDDDGTTHEGDINSLAAADITTGCTATTFCPTAPVLRGQMASFLTRAIPLSAGAGDDYFRDDNGTTHEADIDRAAAAGITTGCGPWRYCPADLVTRGQMAGFLHRVAIPLTTELPHPAPNGPQTLHVAIAGNDAGNDCFTEADPCRTIRWALVVAIDDDTIEIGPGTFAEENLAIDQDLTITGDPGGGTIVDASGGSRKRIFDVGSAAVSIADLELRGGDAGLGQSDNGGAIRSAGDLHIIHARIVANRARLGAGVFTFGEGSLTISDTVISGNTAAWEGGGLATAGSGGVSITDSTIEGNSAHAYAGGVAAAGNVRISGSTIAGNAVRLLESDAYHGGGGMYLTGDVVISNSTIANNSSADLAGGLLFQSGDLLVVNSTFSLNTAGTNGGAMSLYQGSSATSTSLKGVLIVGNTSPKQPDIGCFGDHGNTTCSYTTNLNSIVGIPAGLTLADIVDSDGLADNGGPTRTIALTDSASNPAIDRGHAATCAAAPVSGLDQRGLPRTPPCDIGAYERQP